MCKLGIFPSKNLPDVNGLFPIVKLLLLALSVKVPLDWVAALTPFLYNIKSVPLKVNAQWIQVEVVLKKSESETVEAPEDIFGVNFKNDYLFFINFLII